MGELEIKAQSNEITEYHLYNKLAGISARNREVLLKIANMEMDHYNIFKAHTKMNVKPVMWKVWFFYWLSRMLGLSFGLKLMERGEKSAQKFYEKLTGVKSIARIIQDEEKHELMLLDLIEEKKLDYIGSIVLGLNDALVELTGALAGFTLAFQSNSIIAIAGLITGIAASFSMAGSEYLSTKAEKNSRSPFTAALYTGSAYIITVLMLIAPFFILSNPYLSFGITLFIAIFIIVLFVFYNSIVEGSSFKRRFLEMVVISLGVALLSFAIGFLVRKFWRLEV